jgi:hypothetical protein
MEETVGRAMCGRRSGRRKRGKMGNDEEKKRIKGGEMKE